MFVDSIKTALISWYCQNSFPACLVL